MSKAMYLHNATVQCIVVLSHTNPPCLSTANLFKLLGINFNASLSRSVHISIITAKASKRLYFLKQLREREFLPNNFCISMLQ